MLSGLLIAMAVSSFLNLGWNVIKVLGEDDSRDRIMAFGEVIGYSCYMAITLWALYRIN